VIEKILFSTKTLEAQKRALDAYAERGRVHARNVANAETPGYRARQVRFEEDLQLALRTGSGGRLAATHEKHLGAGTELPGGRLEYRNPTSTWTRNGVNDVEIDREMADIAANTMRYTVSADLVSRAYSGLRKAIRGRVGTF
jgi:flagellar basal-body rod protein FlgB